MERWFFDRARDGDVYKSSNIVATANVALAATHTGLVLSNPVGSGQFLVVKEWFWTPSTAATAPSQIGLGTGPSANSTNVVHTTPCVIHNAKEAGSNNDTGVGLVDESATLPDTPVNLYPLLGHVSAVGHVQGYITFGGTMILRPGTYLASFDLTQRSTGLHTVVWAEILQF